MPPIVQVKLTGTLPAGVTGKDIIIALCGTFNSDEVLNCAIEFSGDGVAQLSVDERLAISNMTTEWGALVGVFPVDEVLKAWYQKQIKKLDLQRFQYSGASSSLPPLSTGAHPRLSPQRLEAVFSNPIVADPGAYYAKTLTLHLPSLVPSVSGPNSVKVATPLPVLEQQNIKINKAYLVSCTNSRASDLKRAAQVMKGKKIAPGVEFYVAAASSVVQKEAEIAGDWATLIQAGAKVLPAGCGPCIGLGTGLLLDGEVGISATNRNYKGRMGSPKAQAYLASPEVVAASAIAGKICGPTVGLGGSPSTSTALPETEFIEHTPFSTATATTSAPTTLERLLPEFPPLFSGPLLFAPQDNLNTDGIYPGKYTYQDDITLAKQAEVVMENYDTEFAGLVSQLKSPSTARDGTGIILASGFNFGTGSSREQAATALLSSGVPLVLCGSFGDIFKRNSINNALICVECPELIEDLTTDFGMAGKRNAGGKDGKGTVQTGYHIEVGSVDGKVTLRKDNEIVKVYSVGAVGSSVQELWLGESRTSFLFAGQSADQHVSCHGPAGGLEGWVKERIV